MDVTFTIFMKDEKLGLAAEHPDDRENWVEAFAYVKNQGKILGALPKHGKLFAS